MSFGDSGAKFSLRELRRFNENQMRGVPRPNGSYEVYSYATKIAVMDAQGHVRILRDTPTRTSTRHRNLVESVWRAGPGNGAVFEELGRED